MKSSYTDILLEDINRKFELIMEMYQSLVGSKEAERILQKDTGALKLDMRTTQAAVTATSKQVHNHEKRITKLESS